MNGTIVNGSITVVPASSTPAVVTGISLGWGSSNSPALIDASGGRLLPAGRTNDMGWFNISRINVTLDHAVSSLNAADISVIGSVGGSYGPVTVTGSGTTWTIALAAPITNADKLILTISNTVTYQRQLDILPGDVDDDGTVTSADLTLLNIAISAPYSNFADMNGDGFIDLDDVALVRGKIGTKRIL
jgi:T5SS/PEP-CTERM-associated repeat protein